MIFVEVGPKDCAPALDVGRVLEQMRRVSEGYIIPRITPKNKAQNKRGMKKIRTSRGIGFRGTGFEPKIGP
jgi:hypothetical protein